MSKESLGFLDVPKPDCFIHIKQVQAGKGKVNVKEGISREGVKKDEFGDKYSYVQVRDNLDPYCFFTPVVSHFNSYFDDRPAL